MAERLSITIGGSDLDAAVQAQIINLEVTISDQDAGAFSLVLGMPKDGDGQWQHVDDDAMQVWSPVSISAGYGDGELTPLLTGYVTAARAYFDPLANACVYELSGMDASVLLDRAEVLTDWPSMKDSDIATNILSSYGFAAQVTDTTVVHDESVATIIQRDTDWRFLQRLALRNGFVFCMDPEQAYFGPALGDESPQPVLAAHFGEDTNLEAFQASVDALAPMAVQMTQMDRLTRDVLSATSAGDEEDALGADRLAGMVPGQVPDAQVHVSRNASIGQEEMTQLCTGLAREGGWFVTAEGEVDSAAYSHVLQPRRLVTVKGVGEKHSGLYYVQRVRHVFDRSGYRQFFTARRDGLGPRGDEDFSGDGLLAGLF